MRGVALALLCLVASSPLLALAEPGVGDGCDTGVPGQCAPGVLVQMGPDLVCSPIQGASTEICDGEDNDCDSQTDEDDVCGCGGIDDCVCEGDGDCAVGYFCHRPVESCLGEGLCRAVPTGGCPPLDQPVCGCDGQTYVNDCESQVAGQSLLTEQACSAPCESCDPPGLPAGAIGNACRGDCTVCGDGILDPAEECDDGNAIDDDSCRNACLLPACGDLVLDPFESCDPPGAPAGVSGNLCSGNCTVCGDGLTDLGEECDDGNVLETDACGATCLAAPAGVVPPGTLVLERALPGLLTLTWAPSCLATDDDFAVYRGVLGDFGSHLPVVCGTSGVQSASLPSPAEDSYYLVVPRNAYSEGSHGSAAAGERSPGQSPCATQKLTSCQ